MVTISNSVSARKAMTLENDGCTCWLRGNDIRNIYGKVVFDFEAYLGLQSRLPIPA